MSRLFFSWVSLLVLVLFVLRAIGGEGRRGSIEKARTNEDGCFFNR